jgi:LPXTG-motif cell wall-anchored protein
VTTRSSVGALAHSARAVSSIDQGVSFLPDSITSTRLPRRPAAAATIVALTVGSLAFAAASPAGAAPVSGGDGVRATAVVLRSDLNVALLNSDASVPLHVALNDVHAPADAQQTLLSAKLKGVDHGRPFTMVRADVASSKATSNAKQSMGHATLAHATVHLPGLPLVNLVKVHAVSSTATCPVGGQPTANVDMVGDVLILGKKIKVAAGGTTTVNAPGVGKVTVALAKKATTSDTAAATALQLDVTVKPASLNVATVTGHVTLVQATCSTPGSDADASTGGAPGGGASDGGASSGADSGGSNGSGTAGSSGGDSATAGSSNGSSNGNSTAGSGTGNKTAPNGTGGDLAETGGSSSTPYIAGTAGALVAAGGAALFLARRRKSRA